MSSTSKPRHVPIQSHAFVMPEDFDFSGVWSTARIMALSGADLWRACLMCDVERPQLLRALRHERDRRNGGEVRARREARDLVDEH